MSAARGAAKLCWTLLLWAVVPTSAIAQVDVLAATAKPRPSKQRPYDVILRSQRNPTHAGRADDPLERGSLLLTALKMARAGDKVELGAGLFDVGDVGPVFLPRGVTIRGQGMSRTRVRNTHCTHAIDSCVFEAAGGVAVEDLWLDADHDPRSDQMTFGFASKKGPDHATAVVRRCKLTGHDFVLYIWTGSGNRIIAEDCEIHGGRFLVYGGCAGDGTESCYFKLRNCRLYGDAVLSGSNSGEEVGYRMAGFGLRGGTLVDTGSQVWIKGSPLITHVRGAWIEEAPHGAARIILRGTRIHLDPNGAKEVWDIDTLGARAPDMRRYGGTGSGPDGQWLVRGRVRVQR